MAYALEARSPLLDHELMEFAASIPAELKVRGREKKWIFREALRGWIPDEILDRPKQGFSVPIGEWFRNDLRGHGAATCCSIRTRSIADTSGPRRVSSMLDRQAAGADVETKPLWACSCSSCGIASSSTARRSPRCSPAPPEEHRWSRGS